MSPNKWQLDTLNFITLSTQIKVILLQMDSFNTIVFFFPTADTNHQLFHTKDQYGVDLLGWACVVDQPGAGPGGCNEPWGEPHTGDVEERLQGYNAGHWGQPKCCQGDAEHLQPSWECAGLPLFLGSVNKGRHRQFQIIMTGRGSALLTSCHMFQNREKRKYLWL